MGQNIQCELSVLILTSVCCDGKTLFCIKLCGSSESKCVRLLDFSYKYKKREKEEEEKKEKVNQKLQ